MVLKNCQSVLKIIPNTKLTIKILPDFNFLPKWWNFPKSGHTEHN